VEASWELIQRNCTGCGICADVCQYEAIRMTGDMAYPEPMLGKCTACMVCVEECPFDTIRVEGQAASLGAGEP
jgi:ferredoxin